MLRLILSMAVLFTITSAKSFINSIGMKFAKISSGSFMMGTKVLDCPKDSKNIGFRLVKKVKNKNWLSFLGL